MVKKPRQRREVKLPHVMSELIKVALKDLKKVEGNKKYVVDMSDWHAQDELVCETGNGTVVRRERICSVCFAGSVMAMSLKTPLNSTVTPDSFSSHNQQAFNALNSLRQGNINEAARELGVYDEWSQSGFSTWEDIPEYDYLEPKPFHTAMAKLAVKLKKAKL